MLVSRLLRNDCGQGSSTGVSVAALLMLFLLVASAALLASGACTFQCIVNSAHYLFPHQARTAERRTDLICACCCTSVGLFARRQRRRTFSVSRSCGPKFCASRGAENSRRSFTLLAHLATAITARQH